MTVNGWRVILPGTKTKTKADVAHEFDCRKIRKVNDQLHWLETQCPHAVILNGTLQTAKGEFNFGVVEWRGGELSGNFTWPQLNDPADFKVKVVDASKLQLIVKQIALEIGARATAETLKDGARLNGYARWKTNRVDFDATFSFGDNVPLRVRSFERTVHLRRLGGMPDVETLRARDASCDHQRPIRFCRRFGACSGERIRKRRGRSLRLGVEEGGEFGEVIGVDQIDVRIVKQFPGVLAIGNGPEAEDAPLLVGFGDYLL